MLFLVKNIHVWLKKINICMGGEKHEGSDEPDIGRKGYLCQVRISKTASRGEKKQFSVKNTDFHKHLHASNPKRYSLV